jgi:hypothetical protein
MARLFPRQGIMVRENGRLGRLQPAGLRKHRAFADGSVNGSNRP